MKRKRGVGNSYVLIGKNKIAEHLSEAKAKRIYWQEWEKWHDKYKGNCRSEEARAVEPHVGCIPDWLEPHEVEAWLNRYES